MHGTYHTRWQELILMLLFMILQRNDGDEKKFLGILCCTWLKIICWQKLWQKKSLICINNNNNVSYICIFTYRSMSYYHITKKNVADSITFPHLNNNSLIFLFEFFCLLFISFQTKQAANKLLRLCVCVYMCTCTCMRKSES